MQNTRIIHRNLWRTGTVIASTTENPQFPAVNSQDDDTTLFYRSSPGSPTGTAYVSVDLGAAAPYDYIAILGHRISSGATINIVGADDPGFSSNVVTDPITWNAVSVRKYLSAARTKRYAKIDVTDASNADGYAQWGTIVLGKYADLGVPFLRGYEDGYEDYTQTELSPSMNLFVTQDAPTFRRLSIEHQQLTDTAKAWVVDLLKNNGRHLAFDICFDYTSPNSNTYWVRLLEISQPKNVSSNYWSWAAVIEEHA